MSEEQLVVFGVLDESTNDEFGTSEFFRKQFNETIETLTGTFLFNNMKEILSRKEVEDDEKVNQLLCLIGVYFRARTEFEKHENKLKIHY
jgi:hypothetical protein